MSVSGIGPRGGVPDEAAAGAAGSHALGRALLNDAVGTVSVADARRILDGALADIRASARPEGTFEAAKKTIAAAKTMADGAGAARTLATFEARGRDAVAARLAELTHTRQLPLDARDGFLDLSVVPRGARITNVRGNERTGFEFEWKAGRQKGTGAALLYEGKWFFSEKKVDRAVLDRATAEFRKYFDREWAPELRDNGMPRDEIKAARAALLPNHAHFPGEEDPLGFSDVYPLVLSFTNETGSDHGLYAGVNPATREVEVGAFN